MAQKYHINPRSGGISACGAKIKCPFGDMQKDHYASREDAQAAYEKKMKAGAHELPQPTNKRLPKKSTPQQETLPFKVENYLGDAEKFDEGLLNESETRKALLANNDGFLPYKVLASKNPHIGLLTKALALSRHDGGIPSKTIKAFGNSAHKLLPYAQQNQKHDFARHTTDQKAIRELVDDARNSTDEEEKEYLTRALYSNKNISKVTKRRLANINSTVAKLYRLDEMEEQDPEVFQRVLKEHRADSFSSTAGETYQFDVDEVKKAGLTRVDIDTLVRTKWQNFLFGANYDESTGIYRGYRD